jgi:hypothetical protein
MNPALRRKMVAMTAIKTMRTSALIISASIIAFHFLSLPIPCAFTISNLVTAATVKIFVQKISLLFQVSPLSSHTTFNEPVMGKLGIEMRAVYKPVP